MTRARSERAAPDVRENEPTAERLRHAGDEIDTFRTDSGLRVKRIQNTLDRMLHARKSITREQYDIAQRIAEWGYLGGLAPIGATDYSRDRVDVGKTGGALDRRIDHGNRYRAAWDGLLPRYEHVFRTVIINEIPPVVYGRECMGHRHAHGATAAAYERLEAAIAAVTIKLTAA